MLAEEPVYVLGETLLTVLLPSPLQGFCSDHSTVLTFNVFVPSLILGPFLNLGQTFRLFVEVLRYTD